MSFLDEEPDFVEVPQIKAVDLLNWVYKGKDSVQVVYKNQNLMDLPTIPNLYEILTEINDLGYNYILVDSPRKMRNSWILDPWWSDHPEMSPRMLKATKSYTVSIDETLAVLKNSIN